ncbi:MAG: serine--tRNA ligase [Bacteroidota bacterium]|nr:serine--tRNA ligase [Bacteroidota bacterium]
MLQLSYIHENTAEVIKRLAVKNFKAEEIVNSIIEKDINRKKIKQDLEKNLAYANQIAKEIGALYKSGNISEANEKKEITKQLKETEKQLNQQLSVLESEVDQLLVQLPNLPYHLVKPGKTADDNEIILQEGYIPESTNNLPHWEIAAKYDIIDFELGNKVTGSGFPFYKNKGAKLQRALVSFFLDEASKEGYNEYEVPLVVNEASGYGTGQLPDKEGQMYHIGLDNLYMIPTAEVPLTNIFRDTILRAEDLPVKCTGYSACFRREAGSYGKDVRGLNRLHQFDKVEIVQIQHPSKSYETLENMKDYVAGLIRKLGLPFRILRLCGGDISFTSAMTYDMETYSIAQKKWLEVSSISNFESFQANRLKLRFRDGNNKTQLVHTLNGSALALPRIVACILENNQTPDGIKIPEVLVPYTGFDMI